jgi:energy-coupling factor transporter ATP-binding protein EcfA2
MLVVENLVHRYAAAPALQIANLRMNRNERSLVAGASGSGKTLLAVFAGLLRPVQGTVMVAASMMGFVSASRHSSARVLIAAVSAVAFAILVSIAATHLHTGLDSDEACAVCAAVIGKLEGPGSVPAVVPPPSIPCFWHRSPAAPHVARVVRVVLPPSCGPPRFA